MPTWTNREIETLRDIYSKCPHRSLKTMLFDRLPRHKVSACYTKAVVLGLAADRPKVRAARAPKQPYVRASHLRRMEQAKRYFQQRAIELNGVN